MAALRAAGLGPARDVQEEVLDAVRANPGVGYDGLCEKTGFGRSTVRDATARLVARGAIYAGIRMMGARRVNGFVVIPAKSSKGGRD